MKLFNTIAIYDVYVVAESGEEARDALLEMVCSGDEGPTEITATESRMERSVRLGYRDKKPIVGNHVSDTDFAKIKGKTTIEIFQHIYTKRG